MGIMIAALMMIRSIVIRDLGRENDTATAVATGAAQPRYEEYARLCDQVLMKHLVLPSQADTADDVNAVIQNIQGDRTECAGDIWDPQAISTVDHREPGGCFSNAVDATGRFASIGSVRIPPGLRQKGNRAGSVKNTTGKDAVGNMIIYWGNRKPGNGADCWLHVEKQFPGNRSWAGK